jgi:PAS domain S-box-containing protein
MDSTRDVLFGVLAAQAGLISADQLAEACRDWYRGGDSSLADLLAHRGWIGPEERAHVDSLIESSLLGSDGSTNPTMVLTPSGLGAAAPLAEPRPVAARKDAAARLAGAHDNGRYSLTSVHAFGGIGRVWRARDQHVGRDVALKELRPDQATPSAATRFLREARITGQLEHPGVVPVYEIGRRAETNQPFYTMRLIQGRTLTEAAEAFHQKRQSGQPEPLGLVGLLSAFVTVCNTLAYAHSRKFIHRDLKGENIIIGDFGEVVVLDWGLAKSIAPGEADDEAAPLGPLGDVTAAADQTVQGQVVGTPAYMAPEQAAGRLDQIGPCTDIYGLGAILYEILTGEPPFAGSSTMEVIRQAQQGRIVPPHERWAEVPPGLEAICQKALAREPANRYASAAELAAEVQGWQEKERCKAEEELRRSRERFDLAVRGSQDGLWDWDLVTNEVYYSPRWKSIIGYEDHEIAHRIEEWDVRLHPDEREQVLAANYAHIHGTTPHYEYEYRLRHKDGTYRWILARGVALRDANGKAYRMAGSHVDVTERRRIEEALRQSEQQHRAIFNMLQAGIVLLDADGTIRGCNPSAERVLNMSADAIVGRRFSELPLHTVHQDGTHFPLETHPAAVSLRTGEACTRTIMGVRRPDGRVCWLSASAQPLCAQGDCLPYAILATFEEVPERQQVAEPLKEKSPSM